MRLFSSTAPSIIAGGGLFIGVVMASFLTSCSSDPEIQEDPLIVSVNPPILSEDLGAVDFGEDPFAADPEDESPEGENPAEEIVQELVESGPVVQEPVEPEPVEPEEEFFFSEDPLDDPEMEVVGNESDALENSMGDLWGNRPKGSRLLELSEAPEVEYDQDLIQKSSELNLARLQARRVADELSREAKVLVPDGIRTFGELLPVAFQTRNPFGDTVELIPPSTGLLLELDWTVKRWMPIGSSDSVKRHRYFRLSQWFLLEADQTFSEFTDIPLELNGDAGSVWVVEVDARIRCAGAIFGEKRLPVHSIEFSAAKFLVLPPGWEKFEDDPLASLERVLAVPNAEVDRHVLVCVALLRGEARQRGVEVLLEGLHNAPNDRRKLTITQALQWLTGLQLGSLPEDWIKWAELRKLSTARNGVDHEPTPGNPTSK
jgi:hypothetical protein